MIDYDRYLYDRAAFRREQITLPSGVLYGLAEEPWQRERFWQPWDARQHHVLYHQWSRGVGKTVCAAIALIESLLFEEGLEAHAFAADRDQAGILLRDIKVMIAANPDLAREFVINNYSVTVPASGSSLTIQASDAASSYGLGGSGRSFLAVVEELWTWTTENHESLWTSIISATGKVGGNWRVLVLSNALIEGVSTIAERVRAEATASHYYWRSPGPIASWITPDWVETQRRLLRPQAFARLVLNEDSSPDQTAIEAVEWDGLVTDYAPYPDAQGVVVVGLDASKSAKRGADTTAAVAVVREGERFRLVAHRIWTPRGTSGDTELLATVLPWLSDLNRRYPGVVVSYDPYNLSTLAQLGRSAGLRFREYPQTTANLSTMTDGLLDAVRSRTLSVYPAEDLRQQLLNAVIVEGTRGVKLAKERSSRKIDAAVALAMALTEARNHAGKPLAQSLHFGPPSERAYSLLER